MMTQEYSANRVGNRRKVLRSNPKCQFVSAVEFARLAVSNRTMVRADDLEADVRGLVDLATGRLYVTEEEGLFDGAAELEEEESLA